MAPRSKAAAAEKSKASTPEENSVDKSKEGPLSAWSARDQKILLQVLLTIPNGLGVSSHPIPTPHPWHCRQPPTHSFPPHPSQHITHRNLFPHHGLGLDLRDHAKNRRSLLPSPPSCQFKHTSPTDKQKTDAFC
jgi:hypothetical protein